MSTTATTTLTSTKATEPRKPRLEPVSLLRYDPQDAVPMQEPTPEPSSPDDLDFPRPPPPALRAAHRRFAPQLVETSRRARRDGDTGPRPTDKTDITPYTRAHKYSSLGTRYTKRRQLLAPNYKRESEDDFLLDLVARRAERKLREAALDVFPNARANPGGDVAHFYFRDSDSDTTTAADSASESRCPTPSVRRARRRRRSTDLGWWHGVMQEHAEQKLKEWQDAQRRPGAATGLDGASDVAQSEPQRCDSSSAPLPTPGLHGERGSANHMDCEPTPPSDVGVPVSCATTPLVAPKPRPALKLNLAGINAAEAEKPAVDPEFEVMRRAASPPLLGDDIVFPRCESPETVRLCTDLPFTLREEEEKTRRDVTQKCGLWRGYCFDKEGGQAEEQCAPAQLWGGGGDRGMLTPGSLSGAGCMWSGGKTSENAPPTVQTLSPPPTPVTGGLWSTCASRARTPSRGLSPFQTNDAPRTLQPPTPKITTEAIELDPAAEAERERRIADEFDDHFVTQVYNYLSLGYPVSARAFDEELCRATGMPEAEITRDDADTLARGGHVCDVEVERCPAERQCPRWKALRAYIRRWAREQADLDLCVGVGAGGVERRAPPRGVWGAGGARVGGSWRP